MTQDAEHLCTGRVSYGDWGKSSPCSRKGKVYEENQWWCTQHSPSAKAKRREASDLRLKERMDDASKQRARQHYDQQAGNWARNKGMTLEDFDDTTTAS